MNTRFLGASVKWIRSITTFLGKVGCAYHIWLAIHVEYRCVPPKNSEHLIKIKYKYIVYKSFHDGKANVSVAYHMISCCRFDIIGEAVEHLINASQCGTMGHVPTALETCNPFQDSLSNVRVRKVSHTKPRKRWMSPKCVLCVLILRLWPVHVVHHYFGTMWKTYDLTWFALSVVSIFPMYARRVGISMMDKLPRKPRI